MAAQIVMDRTGDTRYIFDHQDRAELIRSFDPTAEETLFYPRVVGG